MDNNYPSSSLIAAGAFMMIFFIALFFTLIVVIAKWRIYTKAGKPGWAAIVPFYSTIVLIEIIGKPIWWCFLIWLVPCVNIVFLIWARNLLSKSFGKTEGFTVGLVLLPIIFFPILAFGDSVYLGPGGVPISFGAEDYQRPFNTPEV